MKIQNVHEVVIFLKAESNKFHASHLVARKVVNKYFWEVKESDIDRARAFECSTTKGSCKVHQVWSVNCQDPAQVQYKHLTCFCPCCVDNNSKFQCEIIHHVPMQSKNKFWIRRRANCK